MLTFTKSIGFLLLSIYLILVGVSYLLGWAVPAVILGLLALISGILILINR